MTRSRRASAARWHVRDGTQRTEAQTDSKQEKQRDWNSLGGHEPARFRVVGQVLDAPERFRESGAPNAAMTSRHRPRVPAPRDRAASTSDACSGPLSSAVPRSRSSTDRQSPPSPLGAPPAAAFSYNSRLMACWRSLASVSRPCRAVASANSFVDVSSSCFVGYSV